MPNGESIVALTGLVLQACLLCLMLWRRLHRQFPFFFLYTLYAVIAEIARIAFRSPPSAPETYFLVYWVTEALYTILAFFAIHEVFRSLFKSFYKIKGFWLLLPAVTVLTLIVVGLRLHHLHPVENYSVVGIIISAEMTVSFLQVGIFALFLLLVWFFHVWWRQRPFGIALGFGFSAAGTLIVFLLRSEFGTKFDPIVRVTPPIAYIIAVAVWLATFLRGEPSLPAKSWDSALTPEQMITELRRHTKTVKGILGR